MKANWYTSEFEQGQNFVSAIYRGYTMSVQDRAGFPVEIYRNPAEVIEHGAEFDSMKYAQQWAESHVDFITEAPGFDDVSDLGRMRQIQQEIRDLLEEAISYVEDHDPLALGRAKAYWYPHMMIALCNDHEFMGGSMCSLQDTIEEMEAA